MALILATVREAADHFGIAPSTIHRWAKQGKIRTVQLNGKATQRVIYEDIRDMIGRGIGEQVLHPAPHRRRPRGHKAG